MLPLERSDVKLHLNHLKSKGSRKIKSFNEYLALVIDNDVILVIFAYPNTQKHRFPGARCPCAGLEPALRVLASEQPHVTGMDSN